MNKMNILLLLATLLFANCKTNESKDAIIVIETPMGTMKAKLYDSTPKHKANFIKLAKEGYYDGLLFHRVIRNFMMQGGDPQSKNAAPGMMLGGGGPGYTIPAEFGKFHFKGALAAARTGDQINPKKESSGSQFYIVQGQPVNRANLNNMTASKNIRYSEADIKKYETLGGTPFLDGDYTVFGELIEGIPVLDKICAVQCDGNNRPLSDIKMKVRVQ